MITFLLAMAVVAQLPPMGEGMCYRNNRAVSDMPSGFPGLNTGLGSYFAAQLSSDDTNGNSWCGYPYKDYSNGFAPSLNTMTGGTGAVWSDNPAIRKSYEDSAAAYCGLEALVTNPNTGVSKLMYIIDAFDDTWVRTPGSIDIMDNAWTELTGRPTNNKNDVIQGVQWEF